MTRLQSKVGGMSRHERVTRNRFTAHGEQNNRLAHHRACLYDIRRATAGRGGYVDESRMRVKSRLFHDGDS